jgi:hypothetical protein
MAGWRLDLSSRLRGNALILAAFVLGLWLVVITPLGPNLTSMPGSVVDGRFINYVLEHFNRWLQGLDGSYWSAAFFYPYAWTTAFSNNLLGSAPLYALFRGLGLSRESAFQAWYIFSFAIDYAACVYVAIRLRFSPLATAFAAFFFTFGLPALAQETHAQFTYRFGVPLSCYFLWSFYQEPRLPKAAAFLLALVWQFYLEIYTGILLSILLLAMVLLMPILERPGARAMLLAWPRRLQTAWTRAAPQARGLHVVLIALSLLLLVELLAPYFIVRETYGFIRPPMEVEGFLPRPQSYLMADNSMLWSPMSWLLPAVPQRQEHQLFAGITVMGLVIAGALWRTGGDPGRGLARLHLSAVLCVILLTLYWHGFSFYSLLWRLPGLDGLRAVGRVQLVLMWPLAAYAAGVIDRLHLQMPRWQVGKQALLYGLLAGLILESVLYHHTTLSKAYAIERLAQLRAQLPLSIPPHPILFVMSPPALPVLMAAQVDAMLLSQELGWPTLNGYSGSFPPGYWISTRCLVPEDAPARLREYAAFAGIADPGFVSGMLDRIVFVQLPGCPE